MIGENTVLLSGGSPAVLDSLRRALEAEPGVHVVTADLEAAARTAASARPELAVIATRGPDPTALEVVRALRTVSDPLRPLIVVMPEDANAPPAPAIAEADFNARHPFDAGELSAWMVLARRARDEWERAAEADHLREALRRSEEKTLGALISMIDFALPGAAARGQRNATLARQLAMRFEVPTHLLRDLELAARLHELGRVVTPSHRRSSDPSDAESERWQYTLSTAAILKQIPGMQGAEEMVANIYENWDGTGFPDHWLQGQIPLRCRILRGVIDCFAALERRGGADLEAVLDWMEEHVGTRYDPMVVVHLKAVLAGNARGEWVGSNLRLPITELGEGMVLAEDLYTDAGIKLLSRGTELTPATLQIILRRNRIEPILQGAAVLRRSA